MLSVGQRRDSRSNLASKLWTVFAGHAVFLGQETGMCLAARGEVGVANEQALYLGQV